tara:strand:+ start:683 stop:808 length:126 start_codon:yes stop_codon:yes gene_type:complete
MTFGNTFKNKIQKVVDNFLDMFSLEGKIAYEQIKVYDTWYF